MKYEKFKKTQAYKTAHGFNRAVNYVILTSGIFIITGAIYGIYHQGFYTYERGQKVLDINGIFAAFMVSIVGLVIVIYTFINHRSNN